MAGMDLSARRNARGISVFWMILASGAAVFLLLAIVILTTEQVTVAELEAVENVEDEIIVGAEDDENLQGRPVDEVGAPDTAESTTQGEGIELAPPSEAAVEEVVGGEEGRQVEADTELPADTIAIPAEVGDTAPVAEALDLPEETVAIPADAGPAVTSGDNDNLGPAAEETVTPTLSDPVGADDENPLATE